MRASSGLGHADTWRVALDEALRSALTPLEGQPPDLLLLFASAAYQQDYPELLATAARASRAVNLAGCSASAVIAGARELETEPGLAALALTLPRGGMLDARYL